MGIPLPLLRVRYTLIILGGILMEIACEFCGCPVDTKAFGNYRQVRGWVVNRRQGGSNSVALPEELGQWAHGDCVAQEKMRGPVSWAQNSIF